MINGDRPDSVGSSTGVLTAVIADTSTVIDTIFESFSGDTSLLAVELGDDGTIVRCNQGYLTASGYSWRTLKSAFPPVLFSKHNPSGATSNLHDPSTTPHSYPYLSKEKWCRKDGGYCSIQWFKLWVVQTPKRRFLKLGFYESPEEHRSGYYARASVQLQAFLDSAPDAIITIDDHGMVVAINPATEELFGYARSELVGCNVSTLMPSPDRERHDQYVSRYLETGEARIIGIGREVIAQRKDGSTFPARLSVSEFESHGGRFFTGMLHNISDRIEAEEQRRALFVEHAHTSRVVAMGEMASSIAHEINQPLTAIVSFADASRKLIETNRSNTEKLSHALRQISEQGQRAGEIIRRLREFVKKKEPKRVLLDINEVITTVIELTSHDTERFGIELNLDFHEVPLFAKVDRLQVEQVVLNLIRNSIDSINEAGVGKGRIDICSRLDADMAMIAVSDNGTGIKPSELSNIFKPFYTTKDKGTGLGLSISRSIVEAHDGTLSFQPNQTRGATFTLMLPTHTHE